MKKLALGAAMCFAAFTATAGGMDDPIVTPVMTPKIVEEQAAASSAPSPKMVITLMTLITFGVALGD